MLEKYGTYTYKYIACQTVDVVRHTFINTRALPCQWAQYQYYQSAVSGVRVYTCMCMCVYLCVEQCTRGSSSEGPPDI